MNGILNFSILDGWWPEAYKEGKNGWQLGDGKDEDDFSGLVSEKIKKQDQSDLNSLYKTLIDEILPTYYDNQDKWITMMQQSIENTKEEFSARRMLIEYYERMYGLDEYSIYEG